MKYVVRQVDYYDGRILRQTEHNSREAAERGQRHMQREYGTVTAFIEVERLPKEGRMGRSPSNWYRSQLLSGEASLGRRRRRKERE